jgi:hypothetical protein
MPVRLRKRDEAPPSRLMEHFPATIRARLAADGLRDGRRH